MTVDGYAEGQKNLALRDLAELEDRFAGRPCYEVRVRWFRYHCGIERGASAIAGIEKALEGYAEGDADLAHAHFLVGRIFAGQEDFPAAIAKFERTLELNHGHGHARAELAKASRMHNARRLSENSAGEQDGDSSWFNRIFSRD